MTAEARLRFYASVFDTVEVDSVYYAIPDVRTTARWAERTPPGFLFHVKAWALMTGHHPRPETLPAEVRALLPRHPGLTRRGEIDAAGVPAEARAAAFPVFAAALAPLARAGKLGYVLFQLAPWVHFGAAALADLAALPARLPGFRLAVEFRHRSWYGARADATLAALRAAGLAHVVVDGPSAANAVPRVPVATTPTAIFRLHGRNAAGWLAQLRGAAPAVRQKYDYLYSEAELVALLPEIADVADAAEEVFVAFNNNNRDYPVRNALMLRRLLAEPAALPRRPSDSLPPDLFA